MKKILAIPYSIWAILTFALVLLIAFIGYAIVSPVKDDRKRMILIYKINKFLFRDIWSHIALVPVDVQNFEKIKAGQTYVFVGNHSNLLDIPFSASCTQHYFKPLVKRELLKVPVMGKMFQWTSLPLDRASKDDRKKSMETMVNWVKSGISIWIYPEGTRNRTNHPVKEFYDGAFKLAIEAQVPVAPTVLINARSLQPVDSFLFYPGKVTWRFLDPISTAGMTENDVPALKEKVAKLIGDTLLNEDKFFKK